MGVKVNLDSDDVQALLFSTGVVKRIETAMRDHKEDPQAAMAKRHLSTAHDRVASAWRWAIREHQRPEIALDKIVLDMNDAANMRALWTAIGRGPMIYDNFPRELELLAALGLVQYGPAKWALHYGDDQPEFAEHMPPRWCARLTERGRQYCSETLGCTVDDPAERGVKGFIKRHLPDARELPDYGNALDADGNIVSEG